MHKFAFVCSANICRSPMAHAILAAEVERRGLAATVWSAGIWDFEGAWAAREGRLICEKHTTPMPKLLSTHLSEVDLSCSTRIFVMERTHIAEVLEQTGVAPERVSLLGAFDPKHGGDEIEDPIGKDLAAFEACYTRLRDCIFHYLDTTDDFK